MRQDDAVDTTLGELPEVRFLHRKLMAGIAQQQLVTPLEGVILDGLGQFDVEAIGNFPT